MNINGKSKNVTEWHWRIMEENRKKVIAYLISEYRKNNGILFGDANTDWKMAGEFGEMYGNERPFFWDSLWEDCLVLFCQNKFRLY